MIQQTEIAALILAAGYSSRMEEFKPLLPVGQVTALERCVRLFQDTGVRDVRVVVGYRASDLKAVLDSLDIRSIINDRFDEGMFSSVQAGVRNLEPSTKAFFLLPVDIPLVRRSTVKDLVTVHHESQLAGITYGGVWIPSFMGRRGHPPLVSTRWRPEILSWNGDGGLRALFDRHSCRPCEVPVADEHILMDMDTREQYERILAAIPDYDVPSAAECTVLLNEKFRVPDPIVAHSRKVAAVALNMARTLNGRGCTLDLKLIVAAGLLHDLAKGKPNHANLAAQALTEIGYPAVAEVVASHMNAEPESGMPITAQELVCFADKLVQGDTIVSLETRFRQSLVTCGNDPCLAEKVAQRFSNMVRSRERLETALGATVESVLSSALCVSGDLTDEDLSF